MRARVFAVFAASGVVGLLAGHPTAQEPPVQVPVITPASVTAPVVQAPPQRKLELTFHGDGTVTLLAENATLREILGEWTRKGGARLDGAERLPGASTSTPLKYVARPEQEVLKSLLASAAGVILVPRVAGSAGPSRLDAVVLATSTGTNLYAGQPASPNSTTQFPTSGNPNDEIPPVRPVPQPQPNAEQPQQNQAQPPSPASRPGSVVPIQIVPVTPINTGGGSTTTTPPTTTGRGGGGGGGR
jgi:hypothetical protein